MIIQIHKDNQYYYFIKTIKQSENFTRSVEDSNLKLANKSSDNYKNIVNERITYELQRQKYVFSVNTSLFKYQEFIYELFRTHYSSFSKYNMSNVEVEGYINKYIKVLIKYLENK